MRGVEKKMGGGAMYSGVAQPKEQDIRAQSYGALRSHGTTNELRVSMIRRNSQGLWIVDTWDSFQG
jgi:hypothetical protein